MASSSLSPRRIRRPDSRRSRIRIGGRARRRRAARPRRGRTRRSSPSAFKTDDGVFKVHRGMMDDTDSVLFEIPAKELDKDFVWNVR